MSSRSLGTLTLDLIARIGGFTQGMTEAERIADKKMREIGRKSAARAKEIEKAWQGMAAVITAGFAGITISSVMRKIAAETRDAEQEQAQLAAVLRSTGESAGWSQGKLNDMADAMERQSTFSAGEINKAQTRLLSFTGIVGDQFPKAMQATIDMAARLGTDVLTSVEKVGRALNSPKDGLAALSKQGVVFTDDQKALIEKLQETGHAAEAQSIVLDAMQTAYGGAAKAARDTFGGAISGLQNRVDDLLTGGGGSLENAKKSINDLTDLLGSNETRQAFGTLVDWVFRLTSSLVEMSTEFAIGLQNSDGFFDALGKYGLSNPLKAPSEQLKSIRGDLEDARGKLAALERAGEGFSLFGSAEKDLKESIRSLEQQQNYWASIQARSDRKSAEPPSGSRTGLDATGVDAATKAAALAEKERQAAARRAAQEAVRLQQQQSESALRYLQGLQDQVDKSQALTVYEQLMFDLKRGAVTLTEQQLGKAEGLATALDMMREAEAARAAQLVIENAQLSAQRDLTAQIFGYNQDLAGIGLSDRSRDELRQRNQLLQDQANRLRELADQRNQAQAGADSQDERDRIQAQYDSQLEIEMDFQQKSLEAYDAHIAAKRALDEDWQLGAQRAWENYAENARNIADMTEHIFGNAFSSLEDSVVGFVKTGTFDLRGLFAGIADEVLHMLVRIGIQMAANKLLGETFQAAGVATAITTGAATAAAWAPAAAMASLASFGANAAPASAGIASTTALSESLAFIGFSEGGYTGPGGKYDIAGFVHAGEGVLNQGEIASIGGEPGFNALRASIRRGYAMPPALSQPLPPARNMESGKVVVNLVESRRRAGQVERRKEADGSDVIDVLVADIRGGGRASQVIEQTWGMKRRGG